MADKVNVLVSRTKTGFKAQIKVDGEFYASVESSSYLRAIDNAMVYAASVADEMEE